MAEEKKVVTLDDFEQRLMVSGLMDFGTIFSGTKSPQKTLTI